MKYLVDESALVEYQERETNEAFEVGMNLGFWKPHFPVVPFSNRRAIATDPDKDGRVFVATFQGEVEGFPEEWVAQCKGKIRWLNCENDDDEERTEKRVVRLQPKNGKSWGFMPLDSGADVWSVKSEWRGSWTGFNQQWLNDIRPFRVLRYLNPVDVNEEHEDPQGKLDALQCVADISRATRTTPWVCIPWEFYEDSAFLDQFAEIFDGLEFYAEPGNEAWNWIFPYAKRCRERSDSNDLRGQLQQYVKEGLTLFEELDYRSLRFMPVLSAQYANAWTSKVIAEEITRSLQVSGVHLAVAPYVGGEIGRGMHGDVQGMTQADMFNLCSADIELMPARLDEHMGYAKQMGGDLLAYEMGLHVIPSTGEIINDPEAVQALSDFNRSGYAARLTSSILDAWKDAGGGLACQHVLHDTNNHKHGDMAFAGNQYKMDGLRPFIS